MEEKGKNASFLLITLLDNEMKKLLLLLLTIFILSSCKKCKDCTPILEWTWDNTLSTEEIAVSDSVYQVSMGMNTQEYYEATYSLPSLLPVEYCGDDLSNAESVNESLEGIYLLTFDCK